MALIPGKVAMKRVTVTVASGAATGSSAADPEIEPPAFISGFVVTGNPGNTGYGKLDSLTLNADGSITATTNANVTVADLVLVVNVARVFLC